MDAEQGQSFLGPITSLCCHLISSPHAVGTPSVTTSQLKRIRAHALRNILFPEYHKHESGAEAVSELCRLHAVWFLLVGAGQQERAGRLHGLLLQLGPDPPVEVRAVLRLLLALADRRLGRPPPPPALGRFGTRVCGEAALEHGPPVYSTEYMVPECSRLYMEYPTRVFGADPGLSANDAPPPGVFDLPPGQGVGLFGAPVLSQPGGPLGALVQCRSTAAPGERLRLPPLPADPRRVPFAPETLYRPVATEPAPAWPHADTTAQEPGRRSRSSSPDSAADSDGWEAAARTPTPGRLCWEQRGRRQYGRLPPPLSQAGPAAVPRLRHLLLSWGGNTATPARPVPLPALLAHLRLMMMGLDTESFPFDPAEDVFRPAAGLCTDHCSPEAVAARCGAWVSCGSRCRRVAALAAAGGGGLTQRAFAAAVEPVVRGYRAALAEVCAESLAEFGRRVQPLARLMALLADVCCVASSGSELPQKMALVSHLYERLVGASERTEWALLAHLFKSAVSPYLGFLTCWLLEGVCRDPCDEFAVRELPGAALTTDEAFWTSAYEQVPAGTDNDHPNFLQNLSGGLYQCGRALSLLRLCDATHPLTQPPTELRVRLAFSLSQLEEIQHQVISYESAMQCHVANTLSRHLSAQRRQQLQLERTATQRRHTTVTSIQDVMLAQRRRRAEQKRLLLAEQLRDVERSRATRRQRRLQDQLETERAERERRQDELTALRRENQTRLARLRQFNSAEEVAAMREQLRLNSTGRTDDSQPAHNTAPAPAPAPAPAEPMATSADPSPQTETGPETSPETEEPSPRTGLSSLETGDGGETMSSNAGVSPDGEDLVRDEEGNVREGVGEKGDAVGDKVGDTVEDTMEGSAGDKAADSINKNVAGDTSSDIRKATAGRNRSTIGGKIADSNENVTADNIGGKTGDKTGAKPGDNTGEKTGDSSDDEPEGGADDALNANRVPSPDENANAVTRPTTAASDTITPATDVTTAAATDVTTAAPDVTAAASEVAAASSPSRAVLAERRRMIRRRALGEEAVTEPTEPVLVDQIGGEVLRRRGRNVHGHATDSVIERLLYRGGGGGGAEGGGGVEGGGAAGPAPPPPRSGRRRQVTPRSGYAVVSFQPPDFSVDLLPPGPSGDRETGEADRGEPSSSSQFSLAGTLQHSVALLLNAQLSVVNAALLNHMLVDAGLMEHLVTLRRFLLLADGEFGARLCSQLFHLVNTARTPHQLLSPATLNSVLSEALSASVCGDHPLSERLSFVANTVPDVLDRSSPAVLTCLDLEYRAGWPHCLVLTEKCLTRYRAVFHLFLQLRRAVWALEHVFSVLKTAGETVAARCGGGAQLQRLQLSRHEMQHFVLALQGYLASQVLLVSWAELRRELQHSVHTLDDLRAAHTSYIGRAAKRCLLNAKAEPIMKIVQDVFRIVLKFHAQLSSVQWTVDTDGQVVHPNFLAVMKTHRQFSGYSRFLFKVVNKTKDRFYQPHLNDLANRLNFNGFYTSDVAPV